MTTGARRSSKRLVLLIVLLLAYAGALAGCDYQGTLTYERRCHAQGGTVISAREYRHKLYACVVNGHVVSTHRS